MIGDSVESRQLVYLQICGSMKLLGLISWMGLRVSFSKRNSSRLGCTSHQVAKCVRSTHCWARRLSCVLTSPITPSRLRMTDHRAVVYRKERGVSAIGFV